MPELPEPSADVVRLVRALEPVAPSEPAADPAQRKRPRPGERRVQILQTLAAMLEQPGAEGHVRLLLLPTDERAAAQWTRLALCLEVAELDLDPGRLEGREVRHLTSHRAGVSGLAMVGYRREVHDRGDGAAAW